MASPNDTLKYLFDTILPERKQANLVAAGSPLFVMGVGRNPAVSVGSVLSVQQAAIADSGILHSCAPDC